jgi:hypothetical protein
LRTNIARFKLAQFLTVEVFMHLFVKRLLILSACICIGARAAGDSEWILLAYTDDMTWEGHAGSLHSATNNSGEEISTAFGRATNKHTKRIDFEQWYVRVSDCHSGSGKIATTDMKGNFKYDTDFVLKGGSVASELADILCYPVVESDRKGMPSSS